MSQTAAEVENPIFFDPFECYRTAAKCALRRNKMAVQARRAGDEVNARRHQSQADWLIARARLWRNMIDWTDE